jgi:hypothetical protein
MPSHDYIPCRLERLTLQLARKKLLSCELLMEAITWQETVGSFGQQSAIKWDLNYNCKKMNPATHPRLHSEPPTTPQPWLRSGLQPGPSLEQRPQLSLVSWWKLQDNVWVSFKVSCYAAIIIKKLITENFICQILGLTFKNGPSDLIFIQLLWSRPIILPDL